jgi:predicted helicase
MERYLEFDNICFVDTLDHTGFHEKQLDFLAMSAENTERIKRQNDKTISVIIGNPPYNAKQENFSHNNANRKYTVIDNRIKDTYIKYGTAQNKNILYDMYTRFIRWATDRLDKNGVLAFITNSSFVDALTFDGFRKVVADEFNEIFIVDLGGNIRKNPKLSGTTHNVFGIQTGVAICLMVRREHCNSSCKIYYLRRPENELAIDKLRFLEQIKLEGLSFEHIQADKKYNWINQTNNDFETLLPLIYKKSQENNFNNAIFELSSSGIKSHRDEWVYDFSKEILIERIKYFIEVYQDRLKTGSIQYFDIKWDDDLEKHLSRKISKKLETQKIYYSTYRPYTKQYFYFDKHFNSRVFQVPLLFPDLQNTNCIIAVTNHTQIPFLVQSTKYVPALDIGGRASQCLPLYRYDKDGNRVDNITDWGLEQFQNHYSDRTITKENIFHYTYAILHNPEYRTKYELNLKREFPRIPFYDNFHQWAKWGQDLMDLHINYETVQPYLLKRIDIPLEKGTPKPKLKADTTKGIIILDDLTTLSEIPPSAWEYRLGNRCAIEWILDQYKEKKPKDKTIAEKFNTYRFADYKETVIDLIARVCTVSVETVKIIEAMKNS